MVIDAHLHCSVSFGPPAPYRLDALRLALEVLGPDMLQFGSDCFLPCSGAHLAERRQLLQSLLDELGVDADSRRRIWSGTALGWHRPRKRRTAEFGRPARGRTALGIGSPPMDAGVLLSPMCPGPERRIHVLEVVGNAIVGGMETCVERLVEHLPAEHFAVSVLCPFDGVFARRLRQLGAEVWITAMPEELAWSSLQRAIQLVESRQVDVATRVGGVPDILPHGEAGWLVGSGDFEDMADRLPLLARTAPESALRSDPGDGHAGPVWAPAKADGNGAT